MEGGGESIKEKLIRAVEIASEKNNLAEGLGISEERSDDICKEVEKVIEEGVNKGWSDDKIMIECIKRIAKNDMEAIYIFGWLNFKRGRGCAIEEIGMSFIN